jgi:hypothetical protein
MTVAFANNVPLKRITVGPPSYSQIGKAPQRFHMPPNQQKYKPAESSTGERAIGIRDQPIFQIKNSLVSQPQLIFSQAICAITYCGTSRSAVFVDREMVFLSVDLHVTGHVVDLWDQHVSK